MLTELSKRLAVELGFHLLAASAKSGYTDFAVASTCSNGKGSDSVGEEVEM